MDIDKRIAKIFAPHYICTIMDRYVLLACHDPRLPLLLVQAFDDGDPRDYKKMHTLLSKTVSRHLLDLMIVAPEYSSETASLLHTMSFYLTAVDYGLARR